MEYTEEEIEPIKALASDKGWRAGIAFTVVMIAIILMIAYMIFPN